jgi:hypothetical protein
MPQIPSSRRTRPRHALAASVLAVALPAQAATILGTIYRDGQPAKQLALSLTCPGAAPASAQTDDRGAYRLSVGASGRCALSAGGARVEVVLFNQAPTQYDFNLQGGAVPQLQRR